MSTIAIDMEHLAMDIDMDMGIDVMGMNMDEPSLEFLLKPLTASHVRRAFRGRKSLALLHSWDEIVYRNIKRVFKYKEFEKEWAHIASNEERLMQRVTERKKRHKARALRHKASSSSSRSRRSSSSKKAIMPLRSGRSKVLPKASSAAKPKAIKVIEPKKILPKVIKAAKTSPTRKAMLEASPPKIKIVNGCTYFYPSIAEKKEQSIADGYDTPLSSNSHSV